MTTTIQTVNSNVAKAMDDVVKIYKCCLKLPEFNKGDKHWCQQELEMLLTQLCFVRTDWESL